MVHSALETMHLQEPRSVTLALQGGGAHAAFAWGVLDRLLEEEKLTIEAISGTSAGAINATLLAYGMAVGGRKRARQVLENFWRKMSLVADMFMKPSMIDRMMGNKELSFNPAFAAFDYMTRLLSPYQFNALDFNPMKDVVDELVDFVALRSSADIKLFVNATNVRTGACRVFNNDELSLDVLMASSCLPFLFKTVEIDGEAYWSGGFSGNPALLPLADCQAKDLLVVQTIPSRVDEVPTSVQDIADRVSEISFHASLMQEIRYLELLRKSLTIHRIEGADILSSLGRSSKFNADWNFLEYLRDAGRQTAEDWLKALPTAGKDTEQRLSA